MSCAGRVDVEVQLHEANGRLARANELTEEENIRASYDMQVLNERLVDSELQVHDYKNICEELQQQLADAKQRETELTAAQLQQPETRTVDETRTVGETHTVGEIHRVGESRTVGETRTIGVQCHRQKSYSGEAVELHGNVAAEERAEWDSTSHDLTVHSLSEEERLQRKKMARGRVDTGRAKSSGAWIEELGNLGLATLWLDYSIEKDAVFDRCVVLEERYLHL